MSDVPVGTSVSVVADEMGSRPKWLKWETVGQAQRHSQADTVVRYCSTV